MTTSSGFDTALLQYGAVGVVALLCIVAVRVLFKRSETAYDREKDRADRLEAQLTALNQAIQDRYLTSLNEATRAIGDALNTMRRR